MTPPATFVRSQTAGVALVEPGPTVSVAAPGAGDMRVAGTAALGVVASFFALFAGRPDEIFYVPGAVSQEAERAACVRLVHEGHADLAQEVAGIVTRDFPNSAVLDDFIAYLRARTTLEVVPVVEGSAYGSHEAALRRAAASGVDVLFELSALRVDFDFAYQGKDCAIRPSVYLKYRIVDVKSDRELAAGHAHARLSVLEDSSSSAVAHWLSEPGMLATLIKGGFHEAMPQVWYVHLPSR